MAKTLSDLKAPKSKKFSGQSYYVSWTVDDAGDGIGEIDFGIGSTSSDNIK